MHLRSHRLRGLARAALVVLLASCGKGAMVPEDPVATTITVNPSSLQMTFIGQIVPMSATVRDQNGDPYVGTVTWASNATSVASVTSTGTVRALANGDADVTASIEGISATVSVTVQQVATLVNVVSGDAQEGLAGATLAQPVVAVALDQGGQAVAGTTVTFTPEASHGSVSVTSADTDASGLASTEWTLGTPFGPQRMTVAIDGAQRLVTATSRSDSPTPDLIAGATVTLIRPDPSSLETFRVRNTVRNEGDAASGPFRVQVLADGVEAATFDAASIAAGGNALVELTVGPLSAGQHQLTVVVDADDDVIELNEEDNEVGKAVLVALQTTVSTGATTGLSAALDAETLYRLDVPAGAPGVLTIELSGGGAGDVDLYVEGATRPSARTGYDDCVSSGPTNAERCQLLDPQGAYHIVLHAFAAYTGLTMTITLGDTVVPFDVALVFIDHGTASQDAAVTQAAQRWSELVVGDLPDIDFSADPIAAGDCIAGAPALNTAVDDVLIYVSIVDIDGPLGTLARASPCRIRHQSALPITGLIQFDDADLELLETEGNMFPVILHEMGHVLGIGTIWDNRGLLEAPSVGDPNDPGDDAPGADTHFKGARAIAAFNLAGGLTYTGGARVPVENMAGPGSGDSHWRESVMDEELMTPFLDGGIPNPLSAITVQSLADLGYQVDVGPADPYAKVFTSPPRTAGATGRKIDLRGDVVRRPIVVVDAKGRIVEVRR